MFFFQGLDRSILVRFVWSLSSDHHIKSHGHTHLLERTVVGLLQLATRLLGRHNSAIQVCDANDIILVI